MKICFLTANDLGDSVADDHKVIPFLNQRGCEVDTIAWDQSSTDWSQYEMVIVRSTWDYHVRAEEFINAIERIAQVTRLENSLGLIRWNYAKTYLRDVESRGVPIVPSEWASELTEPAFQEYQNRFGNRLILKPTISATARNTFQVDQFDSAVADVLSGESFMIQPFMTSITNEGEYSLFYFNGSLSHAMVKRPKRGDFRVQEEHGGENTIIKPDDTLVSAGKTAMNCLPESPLYARVDFVRMPSGQFGMMEFELIEPSLYFAMEPAAAPRFANAIIERIESGNIRSDG